MPAMLRPMLFSGSALMLDLLGVYGRALDLDAESIWIILHVTQRSMGSFLLNPDTAKAWHRASVVSDTVREGISRRAVAEETGLPRETVRRKAANLVAQGILIEDAFGRLRIRSEGWTTEGLEDVARQVDEAVERYRARCETIASLVR